jgi:hypothetical protein
MDDLDAGGEQGGGNAAAAADGSEGGEGMESLEAVGEGEVGADSLAAAAAAAAAQAGEAIVDSNATPASGTLDSNADQSEGLSDSMQVGTSSSQPGAAAANAAAGAHQQQQLLLVATKATGDRNVPAGQVTFAVDLGSRSTAGAGHLLQIPHWMHSAVEVNGPGTRPLVIKVRNVLRTGNGQFE